MPIKFRCPNPECKKVLSVKDELAGKRAACPACKKPLKIPSPVAKAVDVDALAMSAFSDAPKAAAPVEAPKFIKMECPMCMEEVEFPAAEAGKRAQCPQCRNLIKVAELKVEKPKDWRQVGSDGMPTGAKRENQEPEGAWGSNISRGRVSRESLEEAGAIPDNRPPTSVATWIKRGVIAAGLAGVMIGGMLFLWSMLAGNPQQAALDKALQPVEKDGKPLDYPPHLAAAIYRSAGEVYLKKRAVDKAQQYLGKARARLQLITPDPKKSTVERDALLIEIALLQIDLGGTEEQAINKTHLEWETVLRDEVGGTLRLLSTPEAKLTGLREIMARLDVLDPGGPKGFAVASRALDAAPLSASTQGGPPQDNAALAALWLGRKSPEKAQEYVKPIGEGVPPSRVNRVAYAEGHSLAGDFQQARTIAETKGGSGADRLEALLAVAAVAQLKGNTAELQASLSSALATYKELAKGKAPPWLQLQLVRLMLRDPNHTVQAKEIADSLDDPGARAGAQLEIFLKQIEKKQGTMTIPEVDEIIRDKESLSYALGLEALAQNNSRREGRNAVLASLESLDARLQPFFYSGVALATKD